MQGVEIFRALFEKLGLVAPALPAPATLDQIAQFEQTVGHKLPPTLIAMYLAHDGEIVVPGGDSPCLFFNHEFKSLEQALTSLRASTTDGGEDTGPSNWKICSVPPGYVQERYFKKDWIPFAGMYAPAEFAIDYAPGPKGQVGQIIYVDGDDNKRVLVAPDFDSFLEMVMHAYDQQRLHEQFGWTENLIPDFLEWRATTKFDKPI